MTQVATIPAPPSVNALFINGTHRSRSKSKDYEAWIKAAGYALNAAHLRAIDGPVYVVVRIGRCNRARDADNFLKPIMDLIVTRKIMRSDNLTTVYSVTAENAFEEVAEGMVAVHICPAIARAA